MTLALQEILSALTQSKVELIINQNRSTMIRILERRRKYIRLSIHQMFLNASNEVIEAIVLLLKNKSCTHSSRRIHDYIEKHSEKYDPQKAFDPSKLETQGEVYNLKTAYDKVNQTYFSSNLKLWITWFGNKQSFPRRQISFGLYHEPSKLIKINRHLDHLHIPTYFLEYIIYHEMLHEIYRPKVRAGKRRVIHTREFKEKEKLFFEYDQAKMFEKQLTKSIFK